MRPTRGPSAEAEGAGRTGLADSIGRRITLLGLLPRRARHHGVRHAVAVSGGASAEGARSTVVASPTYESGQEHLAYHLC